MSGPVDETTSAAESGFGMSTIEVKEGRSTNLGSVGIRRILPTKGRRTIGPWCFVDLMEPADVAEPPPLEIGPHPHIGLSTVTWLFGGEVLHKDSLGTEQAIKPGEVNLMTAGDGIAHAEEGLQSGVGDDTGRIMGAQLWLAQPDSTRAGGSGFQHHKDLPVADLEGGRAQVLIGALGTARAPTTFDHPAVAFDLSMDSATRVPVDPRYEYGVVPIDRPVRVDDAIVEPGALALVPVGFESLSIESQTGGGRLLIVGGLPLGEQIKMWWNFVARTQDELTAAYEDWQAGNTGRFGPVTSNLPRIDAPPPPWIAAGS